MIASPLEGRVAKKTSAVTAKKPVSLLAQGMPMEDLSPRPTYPEEARHARNAEEALLACLSACAERTQAMSEVIWPTETSFGAWIRRLQGQRSNAVMVFTLRNLRRLALNGQVCISLDLDGADLFGANLEGANLASADLFGANLENANLQRANLLLTHFENASLKDANLQGANLQGANLDSSDLENANFQRAKLHDANLKDANLQGADLKDANLQGANLQGANLQGANLQGANVAGTVLAGKHPSPTG